LCAPIGKGVSVFPSQNKRLERISH
jgi:hypothetical protein